jgi:hypothetical protein
MSYFDDASLVMIPSGTKTSKVYSVKPIDGTGDLTFSRSNDTATRVASNGLIERVRTNLALQSQTFDNASWVKAFATITANATTAPDGTLTADKLIANIGYDPVSATGNLRQTNIVATNTHTVSLYAKAAEFTSIRFRENFIVGSFLTIDLTNGSITGAGSQYINPTATAVGDGWYRISFVTPATADLDKYSIRVANTGDGTSGVFIWGFQYEVSDFGPTDYIATTSAAVSVGPVANVPRLDYLGSSCPRLLLEPQTTALNQYSESFDNAYWTKNGTTATANEVTSPDGYQNADLIAATSAIGNRVERTGFSLTGAHTFSIFLKKGTSTRNLWYDGVKGVQIDWAVNGTPTVTGFSGGVPESFGYDDYGNGWYRVWFKNTYSGTISIQLFPDRIGTTGDVYAWGANLTATSYVQSYVPTLGASVTRGADNASKTGISSLIGQTQGTLFVELANLTNYFGYIGVDDTSNNNRVIVFGIGDSRAFVQVRVGGTILFTTSTPVTSGSVKLALAYSSAGSVFYANGVQIGTNATSVTYSALSQFTLNQASQIGSIVNQALLFKTRLTNAQLAELTTL